MSRKNSETSACVRPPNGANSAYFPNVVLTTHECRRALFYDDLLLGKSVMVQFFSTRTPSALALAEHLAKVQPYLVPRLGRDVFLYSITTDPLHDTPAVLEDFAMKVGAQPGWLFLTGEPRSIELLQSRLFSGSPHSHEGHTDEDCSLGMMRYGNEAAGLWGTVPISSAPDWIAQRLTWIMSRPQPKSDVFKRRGPPPLQSSGSSGAVK